MQFKRKEVLLLGILLLAILVRGVNLSYLFQGDEIAHVSMGKSVAERGSLETVALSREAKGRWEEISIKDEKPFKKWDDHPPLGAFFFPLFALLPFNEEMSFRLLPFLGGILAVVFIYLIARKIFNEKVALMAAFLGSFSTYHIFHSSFILESDALLTALIPISFYLYLKWNEEKNKKFFYLTGISLGLVVLTKLTGVIFLVFILLYELLQGRIKSLLGFLIISVLMFSFWIAYDYFIIPDFSWVNGFLEHSLPGGKVNLSERFYKIAYSTGILIEELTPPLFVLFVLSLLAGMSSLWEVSKEIKLSILKKKIT